MNLKFSPEDILQHAVAEIIGGEQLLARITNSAKPLKVKLGIDPTGPDVHLGHTLPMWRLRAFQELGHEIHHIIGDFTGQVGDTSDKESARPMHEAELVRKNMESYERQLWMVLNPERRDQVFFHHNSEWLAPLSFAQISTLADAFSVNDFIKRELVAKRLETGNRVSMRELMYPIMQGYDSLAIAADVELGGTDQRFNLLAGRALQEQAGQPQQALIMNQLVAGLDGRKMSKSLNNGIYLLDSPEEKFGKAMSANDEVLAQLLLLIPRSAQPFTHAQLEERLQSGENPRDIKLELAGAIVALYHGAEAAEAAKQGWIAQFSEQQLPTEIPDLVVPNPITLIDALMAAGFVSSKSDARRALQEGAVRVNSKIANEDQLLELNGELLLQKGKRNFVRLIAS